MPVLQLRSTHEVLRTFVSVLVCVYFLAARSALASRACAAGPLLQLPVLVAEARGAPLSLSGRSILRHLYWRSARCAAAHVQSSAGVVRGFAPLTDSDALEIA